MEKRKVSFITLVVVTFLTVSAQRQAVDSSISDLDTGRITVGAIRWDAWFTDSINPYEKNLADKKWHGRLPFYAKVLTDSTVEIRGDNQETIDQEIAYAKAGGLDYWAFLYYTPSIRDDGFNHDYMNRARRLYLSSKHKNDINFCLIVYPKHGKLILDPEDPGDEIINEWISMMLESNYQKVAGDRPLLYLMFWGPGETIENVFGSVEKGRAWLDALRERIIKAGLKNPYFVTLSQKPEMGAEVASDGGLDAISSYTSWGGPDYKGLSANHIKHWDAMKATGKKVVPNLSAGWGGPRDGRGDMLQAKPGEIGSHVRSAFNWIEANPEAAEAKTMLWYAWNEMDEGGWLVPDKGRGTAKLDEIRAVVDEYAPSVSDRILPSGWDPKREGDHVLKGLYNVCSPRVKGAHDGYFVIADKKAYISYMANDVQPDENPGWPFIYNALSIVDIETGTIRKILPFASSEKVYDNEKLPVGSCFVARILQKDKNTLRVFFASENPGVRQSQTWYIDFDLDTETFENKIYKAKIKTKDGVFDMQPRHFFQDALAYGFTGDEPDYGLYPFDIKRVDHELYTSLSIYPNGPVGFGKLNKKMNTFEVIGFYFQPLELKLNESALERLPEGSWMAITRQELGTRNYVFSTSKNGKDWTANEYLDFIPNGTNAKPVFEYFNGIYYLGWQEETKINDVFRSVYNIDVSRDAIHWERKYRFETEKSFQYPHLVQYEGSIYLTITQGDTHASRKERIMFGKLE